MAVSTLARYRPGCVEKTESGGLRLTGKGLAEVLKQAALGASPAQVAAHLRVSAKWFTDRLNVDHDGFDQSIYCAYCEGRSELATRLRENQLALSETNAAMAIHLGKHYLEQHDRPVEHNHRHMVVGTMPDYEQTPDDWKRQFAPTALQDTIEDNTVMNLNVEKIEDAVVVEEGDET